MKKNVNTTHAFTYYYAGFGNPRTWMQVSGWDDDAIQYEALDWCDHKHRTADAASKCLNTLDSYGYFYPLNEVIQVAADGQRPIDLCAIGVSHG
jgi:hypothetical protein